MNGPGHISAGHCISIKILKNPPKTGGLHGLSDETRMFELAKDISEELTAQYFREHSAEEAYSLLSGKRRKRRLRRL